MGTSLSSVYNSSDLVKDYVCHACKSKNIEESADYFCAPCIKLFYEKCIHQHDQLYANHDKYGRGQTNKWPLPKTMEDLLLKCDVHNEENLTTFCQDHSQLCCSDCVLLNHRKCTNVTLVSETVKKMEYDMRRLSINLQTILDELKKLQSARGASIQSVEVSYSEKLQEITNMRKKLNAALDELENATLKELDEIRTTLQTSLKNDVDNCRRLDEELKQLSEAIDVLCDKSKKETQFIASRKCLDKIQHCKSFLKENPMEVQSSIIFKANIDIEKYLSQQASLGSTDSMQSPTLKMNPDQAMTVRRTLGNIVRILNDTEKRCHVSGMCFLRSGQVIFTDTTFSKVKLLDEHYNVSSHCDLSGDPNDVCQITSNEVAVIVNKPVYKHVQFISVTNGQLVIGRQFRLPHIADGIAHHQGALYITSGTALYHYTLTGSLVRKLYEDQENCYSVFKCAVSPAGDRIYVTNMQQHKLITLASDGTLISTFTDPDLQQPWGVHVTPSGQVLVCGCTSQSVIQVDHEGRKKVATLASRKDELRFPMSICCNTNLRHIIVGQDNDIKINVMELQ